MHLSKLVVLTIILVVTNIDHHLPRVAAQDNPTQLCFAGAKSCDDFKKCCEAQCPAGATAICTTNGTAPAAAPVVNARRRRALDTGFMAGGAPEEVTQQPQPTQGPSGSDGIKISDTHCACLEKTRAVVSMTISCLSRLGAPDQCPSFEKCCEESCSKNAGHATLCGQNADGTPTPDTECLCLNALPNVPGWSELEQSKNGKKVAEGGEQVEFQDHTIDCFNHTDTCKDFEDCCVEECKKSEYTGSEQPVKMCAANKWKVPMKSTHTFCRCPKGSAVFSVQLWSDGDGGAGEVSQIFKGGGEYDYDGVGQNGPSMAIFALITSIAYFLS